MWYFLSSPWVFMTKKTFFPLGYYDFVKIGNLKLIEFGQKWFCRKCMINLRMLPFLKFVVHCALLSSENIPKVGTWYENPVFGGNLKVKFETMTSMSLSVAISISFRVYLNPRQSKWVSLVSDANSYSSRYQSPKNWNGNRHILLLYCLD